MKFNAVLASFLTVGVAVASPMLETRQSASVLVKDIAAISAGIAKLNNTVQTLRQGDFLTLVKALTVQSQAGDLLQTIKTATADAKKTPQLSDDDSFLVVAPVLDLLAPIQVLLNNLVAKKPVFATAVFGFGDLSKTVLKTLQDQGGATKALGAAIVPILSEAYQGLAPSVLDTLNGYFADAVAAYSKCTGKVCLPPFPSITIPKALPKPKA